jgi:lipopolysaccharide transport system permease protein
VSVDVHARPAYLPAFGWLTGHLELLRTMLRRELRSKYKGSSLGILWSYVYPLAMMGVYTLVFSVLWHAVKIPHYPLFVLTGLALWAFFQSALQLAAGSIPANGDLIRNVWFPRELIPLAIVLSQALSALIMFVVLVPIDLVVVPEAARTVLLAVPIFVAFLLLAIGLSWIVATLNVFFRDVEHLLGVLFLPWFFLTPVLYSLEQLPGAKGHDWLIHLLRYGNPVAPYVEGIRGAILQGSVAGPSLLVYVFVVGPLVALLGLWVIQRYEDRFAVAL